MEVIVNGASDGSPTVSSFLSALERGGALSEPLRKVRRSIADYVVSYKNRALRLHDIYLNSDDYTVEQIQSITAELNGRREAEVLAELRKLKSAYIELVGGDIKSFLKSEVINDQGFYDWVNGQTDLSELIDIIVPESSFGTIDSAMKELKDKLGELPETVEVNGKVPNKTRSDLKCLRDCKYQWEEESQLLDVYIDVMRDLSVSFAVIGEIRSRLEKAKQRAVVDAFKELNQ